MKIIIPAKTGSCRVPNKNWREFHAGRCLVEVCLEKLDAAGIPRSQIWISTQDETKRHRIEQEFGCNFHRHGERFCHNNAAPITDWIRETVADIAPGETIGWAQVTTPLFNEYGPMLEAWERLPVDQFDSMCAVYPMREFIMDEQKRPIGWGFGEWHRAGQDLPTLYRFPWSFSIRTPAAIRRTGYYIGARPYWYECLGQLVDIDTMEDWEFAQWKFSRSQNMEAA